MQPGATITPGAAASSDAPAQQAPELPSVPRGGPTPASLSEANPAPVAASQTPSAEHTPPVVTTAPPENSFTAGSLAINPYTDAPDNASSHAVDSVRWTASEFIAHQKSTEWYGVLFGGAVLVAVIVWIVVKDLFSTVVVLIAVGILAGYASRQPRELEYGVDESGIAIGPKRYPFKNFRSFSIVHDGGPFSSIEFMPMKRFALPLTIYYDPADESKIADAIAAHVPYEERKRDPIDQLMRHIKF